MKVSRYMTQKLHTARPDEGARAVFFRMRAEGIRHMPVVDGDGHLVGWISDRDLRRPDWADPHVDLGHAYELDDATRVGDLMNPNPVVARTYERLSKVVAVLRERRFGAVPVLDKKDVLVGVLSAVDLLGALADLLDERHAGGKKKG